MTGPNRNDKPGRWHLTMCVVTAFLLGVIAYRALVVAWKIISGGY